MLLGLLKENEASKGMPQQQLPQQTQMGQLPQRQSFQQQGDPSQHPTPPFPQYASSPQLTLPFGQQMTQSQDQMPPPSSYYSGQQKPVQQQQYQVKLCLVIIRVFLTKRAEKNMVYNF